MCCPFVVRFGAIWRADIGENVKCANDDWNHFKYIIIKLRCTRKTIYRRTNWVYEWKTGRGFGFFFFLFFKFIYLNYAVGAHQWCSSSSVCMCGDRRLNQRKLNEHAFTLIYGCDMPAKFAFQYVIRLVRVAFGGAQIQFDAKCDAKLNAFRNMC